MAAGDILWSKSLDGSEVAGRPSIFLEDDIFVMTAFGTLYHLRPNGDTVWSVSGLSGGDSPGGALGAITGDNRMVMGDR